MALVDTHCHLNHEAFDDDLIDVLARARAADVRRLLVIGCDLASNRRAVLLAQAHAEVRASIGIHPESGHEWSPDTQAELKALWASGVVLAYGEIGLDYHWDTLPRDRQAQIFREQIAFAGTLSPDLPIVVHCRDAFGDVLGVIREAAAPNPFILHCFTGGMDDARASLDLGCWLGFGGIVTFPKSGPVRETAAFCPLDRMLLETDCPFLAPQPWRGKRNEPSYVTAVASTIAECRSVPVDEIAEATTRNAEELFRWR